MNICYQYLLKYGTIGIKWVGDFTMGRAELQGTPWHYEQMQKTSQDGSKYCIYNRNNRCRCTPCEHYKQSCKGKGSCSWFETKTGVPKVYNSKTVSVFNPNNAKGKLEVRKVTNDNIKSEKHDKFIELAEKRVNTIIDKIDTLENLSNKNQYEYTQAEIDKMFKSIEEALANAKESFITKNKGRFKF